MIARFALLLALLVVGCGKVAQDISTQSSKSSFKKATFSYAFFGGPGDPWAGLVSTPNVTPVYSYFEGISFDRGVEKIGWVQADVKMAPVDDVMVPSVSNYDRKKNLVTSSRYQQGVVSIQKTSTDNYRTTTRFRKVRPKFDYYSFSHFLSEDTYRLLVVDDIPTTSVDITPYDHMVSAIFLQHVTKESYNRDTVIPLSVFYAIIPTQSVTPTLNITPKNTVKSFDVTQPRFRYEWPLFDSLLDTVTLSYFGDEYEVVDYVNDQESSVFSDQMKDALRLSVSSYFESKKTEEAPVTDNIGSDDGL